MEIIREYDRKYPGVFQLLLQKENQYSQGKYNVNGLFNFPRAKGRYIAYCDGDDYWVDDRKLQKQVDYMEAHPECSLCFHAVNDVDEDGKLLRVFRSFSESKVPSAKEMVEISRIPSFSSWMFRTEYAQNLPDFYFQCRIGDIPLMLILLTKGEFYYMDDPMTDYRVHANGSWTSQLWRGEDYQKKLKQHVEEIKDLYRAFDRYSEGRYAEAVEYAVKKQDFAYIQGIEDFRGMLRKEYRPYYRALPLAARIGYRIGAVSPKLYHLLKPKNVGHR